MYLFSEPEGRHHSNPWVKKAELHGMTTGEAKDNKKMV